MTVVLGDNPFSFRDIETSLNLGIPIIVVEGSDMASEIFQLKEANADKEEEKHEQATGKSKA